MTYNTNKCMTTEEKELARKWVEAWRTAGPELERDRRKRIGSADTKQAIEALSGTLRMNIRRSPKPLYSGLIEQQKIFAKGRLPDKK